MMVPDSPRGKLTKLVEDDNATMTASSNSSESSSSDSVSSSDGDDEVLAKSYSRSQQSRRRRKGVKRIFKTVMRRHGGSTRHPRVSKMIHKLEAMNPTQNAVESPLMIGDFVARSSPDFPGRIRRKSGSQDDTGGDDDAVQYTLGRLSFGIFQPHNLVCTITTVRNSIQVCEDVELHEECVGKAKSRSFHYPLIIDLTIHSPKGDLPAVLRHEALCYEIPSNEKRLGVTFLGGTLMPDSTVREDDALLDIWKETFANAYTKAEEDRSYMGKALRLLLKWWLKLSVPKDEDAEKSELRSVHYEIKRRPKGHLDIIYLDEDLRITKGNRGTIIVVEREHSTEDPQIINREALQGRD